MLVKERAIILSKTKYGEADLILKLLTAQGEVYSAIAKSAMRSRKRFGGGVLEPTHYVNFSLSRHEDIASERLAVISEAQLINDFASLKKDYDRLELALHFVRAVALVAREGDMHIELFNLLGHALKECELASDLKILKLQFDLKVLHTQGVLPHSSTYAELIRTSIRESSKIELSSSDRQSLIYDVEHMLNQYLN